MQRVLHRCAAKRPDSDHEEVDLGRMPVQSLQSFGTAPAK